MRCPFTISTVLRDCIEISKIFAHATMMHTIMGGKVFNNAVILLLLLLGVYGSDGDIVRLYNDIFMNLGEEKSPLLAGMYSVVFDFGGLIPFSATAGTELNGVSFVCGAGVTVFTIYIAL